MSTTRRILATAAAPREDVGWKMVACTDCGRSYVCTPADDYYNFTTATDGVCTRCLMASAGLAPDARQLTMVIAPAERP